VPQIFTPPATPTNQRLPASSSDITHGLSIQHLVEDVVKKQKSLAHSFWHILGVCECKNLDELAKLDHVNFPGLYYNGGYGDFDKFGPMEHNFVVKKRLPPGGEAASCIVMQHISTKRLRKLYVFKTITNQRSLRSHSEWGIVSNEAFVLLEILKTNLQPHPNIIQLFNCITSKAISGIPLHILQMEYCSGGDLWDLNQRFAKRGARIHKTLVAHAFTSLIAALAYLHHGLILSSNNTLKRWYLPASSHRWQCILHNDIKPENILLRWPCSTPVTSSTFTHRFPEIVLSDFGIAGVEGKVLGPKGTYRYSAPEVQEAFDLHSSYIRHFNFKAADIINDRVVCTFKSDIWSLGKVMEEMMPEYLRVDGRKTERARGRWTGLEKIFGEVLVGWTRACLGVTALGRPSARALLGKAVKEIREDGRGEIDRQKLPAWI